MILTLVKVLGRGTLLAAWFAFPALVAAEGIISLNFSENSGNQGFVGGELIGPLATDSSFWNNTNGQPDLVAGSMSNLIDDDGTDTGAVVTWSSSNVWWNTDGTADDQSRMAVGYLDDGDPDGDGVGVSIVFDAVPYDVYRVYGLLASDQGNEYDTRDFTVNGQSVYAADTAPAFGNMSTALAATGELWSRGDRDTRGNYWTTLTSGSTLTITAPPRDGASRASITAVIIKQVPEPAACGMAAGGLLWAGAALRRRVRTGSGRDW